MAPDSAGDRRGREPPGVSAAPAGDQAPAQSVQAVLQRLVEECGRLVRADVANFRRLEGHELVRVAVWGDPGQTAFQSRIRVDQSLSGYAVTTGETVLVNDPASDLRMTPEHRAIERRLGLRASLSVPLKVGGAPLGVLILHTRRPEGFSPGDVEIASAIGAQAAIALDNARLLVEEARRRAQFEALDEIGRQLLEQIDEAHVLGHLANAVARVFAGDSGIYMVEGDELVERVSTQGSTLPIGRMRPGEGVVGETGARRAGRIVNDYQAWPGAVEIFVAAGLRHVMAQPLAAGERLFGVLSVGRAGADAAPFTADDLEVLGRFAGHAALALRNGELFREAQRGRADAEALARAAWLVTDSLEPETIGRHAIELVRALLGVDHCSVRLLRDGGLMETLASTLSAPGDVEPLEGAAARAAAEERAVWSADVLVDPDVNVTDRLRARVLQAGQRSVLAVPLRVRRAVIGIMRLTTSAVRSFSDREVALAQAVGDQVAVALDNARLYDLARRDADRTAALAAVQRLVSERLDFTTVGQRIVDSLCTLLDVDLSVVYRLDETSGVLVPLALSAAAAAALGSAHVTPGGTGIAGAAVAAGEPVKTPDLLDDPRIVVTPEQRTRISATGLRAALGCPLTLGGAVIGALGVGARTGRVFTGDEVRVVRTFADQAAVALENARLYANAERRREEAESLADVNRMISQSLDLGEVADRIVRSVSRLFGGTMAVLYRGDASADLTMVAGVGDVDWNRTLRRGTAAVGLALASGRPVTTHDVVDDPRIPLDPEARERMRRSNYRAVLAVPLVVQDRQIGALGIGDRAGRVFTPREIALAEAFAQQAALAMDHARLYEETRRAYEDLKATQDQLAQSQKMEAVGRLAGGIAHEFNNLLTVILGRVELLLLRPDCGAVVSQLDLVRRTAHRATELTQQLLAFSRRQIVRPRVIRLNDVVMDLSEMLARLLGEDIELVLRPGAAVGLVRADPGQISQVLVNLVVNARGAMPRGGRLTIETTTEVVGPEGGGARRGLAPGSYVVLAVSDTGCGMSAETIGRIFEPFFTTKPVGQGTGLGLSMVYGIITQNGGTVEVESTPGERTTFRILLPSAPGPPETEPPAPAPVAAGSETILLVEDADEVRDLARDILEARGFVVLVARDGVEALRLAEQHGGAIDLLLTDVVMPHLNGREVAERVTRRRPATKVLYMSGYTDDVILRHGVADAGPRLLAKPFTPAMLLEAVRAALDAAPRVS